MLGTSIGHLTAVAGVDSVLKVRPVPGAVERCQERLRLSIEHEVEAGRTKEDYLAACLARLLVSSDYSALADCEIVLECVPEKMAVKRRVLSEAEEMLGPGQVLASSTSALSIGALAVGLARPECFVGMHYFWPAHRRRLVEIAPHAATDGSTLRLAHRLARVQDIQVLPVTDSPGFLTTRSIFAFFSEAIRVAEQGVPIEEIDCALKAFGWPMGAFHLMDLLTFETLAEVYDSMIPVMGERGEGIRVLRKLIRAGHGGRRYGSGFYLYDGDREGPNPAAKALFPKGDRLPTCPDEWALRPTHMMIHEAAHCLAEGVVAAWQDVELGATIGLAFPTRHGGGMLGYLREIGWETFVGTLVDWEGRYGERFRPYWKDTVQPPALGSL